MGRSSIFDHPLLLGFEEIERTVGGLTKSAGDGYPPYNIEQTRPGALRITLAVAGFAEEQLSITIESRQLVVRCKQGAGGRERVFLRRGIAARQFQRSFVLANGIEVGGASLEPPPYCTSTWHALRSKHWFARSRSQPDRTKRSQKSPWEADITRDVRHPLASGGSIQHPLRALPPTTFAMLGAVRR